MASVLNGDRTMTGDQEVTLDLAQTRQNFGSDEDLLLEIANVFVEDVPLLIDELEAACLRNDSTTVARLAHSLKGLCATFGAEPARTYAQGLELDTGDCSSPFTRDRIQVLIGSLEQTILTLRQQLHIS